MNTNLSPISVLQRLRQLDLFFVTPRLLIDLFDLSPSRAYRLLAQLKQMNLAAEVENGKYLVLGLEPERVLANPLFIASQLAPPGYVSFWTALHYYGFTEQTPRMVFVATVKKKRPVHFHGHTFRFVTVQPRKFFGYRREPVDGLPVLLADEAKAIVDSLSEPRYAGGVAEAAKALHMALPQIDVTLLVEYANRMGDRSLGSRLGFLLSRLGHAAASASLIRSSSPVKLDPTRSANGNRDTLWQIYINLTDAELFPMGVQ
ncbi:MAG: hypothetical protein HUU23_08395 [Caldilineales bacterium]|nr:hypothetical protein [Caldilineales bacterium]